MPDVRRRWSAPLRPRNYRAVWSTLLTSHRPVDSLSRYVRGSGRYPWRARLRTPTGPVELLVPHPHDVRTVNEVFHRHDYGTGAPTFHVSTAVWPKPAADQRRQGRRRGALCEGVAGARAGSSRSRAAST